MKVPEKSQLEDKVYKFKTKHKEGFIKLEITKLLEEFPNVDMKRFNNALQCVTGMIIGRDFVTYHCDIYKALICGIEKRDLYFHEWD